MNIEQIKSFILESNRIERIMRDGTEQEIKEFIRFINLSVMTVEDIEKFVHVYQPDSKLRNSYGMNVRVGNYHPPFGNPEMKQWVTDLLNEPLSAYHLHNKYEKLHPFMDGNGRSGRALWAWRMKDFSGSFLENYYFQTLSYLSNNY